VLDDPGYDRTLLLTGDGYVMEAVAEYDARTDRLSEAERLRMLEVLDRLHGEPVARSRESVEAEIQEIRRSRRESSLRRSVHDDPS